MGPSGSSLSAVHQGDEKTRPNEGRRLLEWKEVAEPLSQLIFFMCVYDVFSLEKLII